ncbi:hypothetical protein DRF65_28110, partial [Chryseobacterium pennae]
LKRYTYDYYADNKLKFGHYSEPWATAPQNSFYSEYIIYDLNGNITQLYRNAKNSTTGVAMQIDDLTYSYAGNRLQTVTDGTQNNAGYEGGGNIIEYDLNGSMTSMKDKGITSIAYNFLNLPDKMIMLQSGVGLTYLYGANGTKLQKVNSTYECGIVDCYTVNAVSDYLDGFQYMSTSISRGNGGDTELLSKSREMSKAMEIQAYTLNDTIVPATARGSLGQTKNPNLSFFPTAEGYYDYQKDQYIYQYKDHLGNVRISFGRNSAGALEITDANDYYPFGMNHLNTGNTFFGQGTYKNYKYNGKELQETGMYDYGARFYMPDIGRWGVVDPLAETSRRWSTYTYAYNNPIRFIDPDGMENKDIHLLGNLADKALEQLNANSSLAMTKDSNGKLDTTQLSKSAYNKLSDTDKVLYDGIKNSPNTDSRIYAENNNITPDGGLIPGGSFGGANYDSATKISTGTQYTNPEVLGNAESFTGTQKGTGMTHEVVENVLITRESLKTKSDVSTSTFLNPSPVFNKFHDQTRAMMPYDNIAISARTRNETTGRKYYEGFAGKIDVNGKVQKLPLYKVYADDKRLKR